MPNILLFGRWASERAAREYIRRGEVGVMRARVQSQGSRLRRAELLSSLGARVWIVASILAQTVGEPAPRRLPSRALVPDTADKLLHIVQLCGVLPNALPQPSI